MKAIQSNLLYLLLFVFLTSPLLSQSWEYSSLALKHEVTIKGASQSIKYELVHYLGSERERTILADDEGIGINAVLDRLNQLSKEGWEIVDVFTIKNLLEDDVDMGLTKNRNTEYHQYLLRRKTNRQ